MLQEDLSLAGLLTCSFMFLELTGNFVMPALLLPNPNSVAVVTGPRRKGCILATKGKSNQRDACVEVRTKGCSEEITLVT